MRSHTNPGLEILLKGKRIFVAIYSPLDQIPVVDFTTGDILQLHSVTMTEGAVLSSNEVKSFTKESVHSGASLRYLLMEDPKTALKISDKIVVVGQTHTIRKIFDSVYGTWSLVILEEHDRSPIFTPSVMNWRCSDRVKVYLDSLNNGILSHFSNIVPDDLLVWPICGFDLQDSLQYLYPTGHSASLSGQVEYKELGRKSGYSGDGQVAGSPTKLAKSCPQTNYPELNTIIDDFNTNMGRL